MICGLIRRIEQSVPELCSIGRVGGEEFTILLPRYSKAQSVIVAGYIHALLNASPLNLLPNQLVTASLLSGRGIADKSVNADSLHSPFFGLTLS